MKRCPTCYRVETDETLKFCRDDGALLVSDSSVGNDYSATRILPASQTGEAQALQTEARQTAGTTSALDARGDSTTQTGEQKERRSTSSVEYIVSGIRGHKIAALISLIVIAAGIVGIGAYLRARNSEVTIESIAVLPFVNQNNDPGTEYLSDGIPESIINSLSQLPNLKVLSRNSVFRYKGKDTDAQTVAKELKVQAVLTGRVAQRGDGLSISVELVNALDGRQIWGQQYNRRLADVFAVQEEMAKEISEKLRLKLTSTEQQQLAKRPTGNLKAFQYYMQGRAYTQRRTREDLLEAIRYCEKPIEEDRNYALAYAGLADAWNSWSLRLHLPPLKVGANRKRLRTKPSRSMKTWPKPTSHLVKPTSSSPRTFLAK